MDKRTEKEKKLAQNVAAVYNCYFEKSIPSKFWDEIIRGSGAFQKSAVGTLQGKDITPKSMAKDLRHKIMKIIPMVRVVGDWDIAGYLVVKFAILAEELEAIAKLKNMPEVNKMLKAKNEIQRFREFVKYGKDYQREPDKQYLIFTGGSWNHFCK